MSSPEGKRVLLDLRPLQGGDAARGIGSVVRALAGQLADVPCLLWQGRPAPPEADGRTRMLVRGPSRHGRLSWALDGFGSSGPRHFLTHLHTPDPSWGWTPATVITVHDTIPWRFPDLYPAGPTGKLRMELAVRMARSARLVVTPSTVSAEDVVRFFGVSPQKVRTVPWGADPGLEVPEPSQVERIRARLRLPGRYMVMAGGFAHVDPRKRYDDAVLALSALPPEVGLVVTGSTGPAEDEFRTVVEATGMASRVFRTGHMPVEELAAVFAGASVFVFPSVWEGFGLPLVNAMTLGVPAVVSRGGSLPEVAGDAALYHTPGDVEELATLVGRVLSDDSLARRLSGRGLQRSKEYSWDRVGAAYRRVYREAGGVV